MACTVASPFGNMHVDIKSHELPGVTIRLGCSTILRAPCALGSVIGRSDAVVDTEAIA
ncbi:MAG: hypothetical protein MUF54_08950 [Polyangiaceae bacterium]|nr:hypothetical protein [Polyangiaceae bacterium]